MSSSARRNSTALRPVQWEGHGLKRGRNTTEEKEEEEEEEVEEEGGPICTYMYDYAKQYPTSLSHDSEAFPGE